MRNFPSPGGGWVHFYDFGQFKNQPQPYRNSLATANLPPTVQAIHLVSLDYLEEMARRGGQPIMRNHPSFQSQQGLWYRPHQAGRGFHPDLQSSLLHRSRHPASIRLSFSSNLVPTNKSAVPASFGFRTCSAALQPSPPPPPPSLAWVLFVKPRSPQTPPSGIGGCRKLVRIGPVVTVAWIGGPSSSSSASASSSPHHQPAGVAEEEGGSEKKEGEGSVGSAKNKPSQAGPLPLGVPHSPSSHFSHVELSALRLLKSVRGHGSYLENLAELAVMQAILRSRIEASALVDLASYRALLQLQDDDDDDEDTGGEREEARKRLQRTFGELRDASDKAKSAEDEVVRAMRVGEELTRRREQEEEEEEEEEGTAKLDSYFTTRGNKNTTDDFDFPAPSSSCGDNDEDDDDDWGSEDEEDEDEDEETSDGD